MSGKWEKNTIPVVSGPPLEPDDDEIRKADLHQQLFRFMETTPPRRVQELACLVLQGRCNT
jgi:hypothetical protein